MSTRAQVQIKADSKQAISPAPTGILQRKCACGGAAGLTGECAECSNKKRLGLQTKLKVNEPGDIYEQEADRIADQVMATPAHPDVRSAPPRIQRFSGQPAGQLDTSPASVDQALASPGSPLEPALQQDMEQRFGHDFSRVRVHSDAVADHSARDVNAYAYTVGQDIVFGAGRFAPETHEGRRLIAHELTHIVQQKNFRAFSDQSLMQREPAPQKKDERCTIKNARAFIYFEISRTFKDPNDPQVLKRANCLKEAFGMLSADDAVEFAKQIIKKDPNWFYLGYETLATPTRIALAEILVDILKRKDTETYLARLLPDAVVIPYDDPKFERPAIVTAKVIDGRFLQITLDREVVAGAMAEILGDSECEKYAFGFTQFDTDSYFIADYYNSKLSKYWTWDYGVKMKSSLPCQDVFHDGDVWSYTTRLECGSKQAGKKFSEHEPMLTFSDIPSTAAPLFPDLPQWELRGVSWTEKFVTLFSVMLPNGIVRHLYWFDWGIDYCENNPLASIGKRPSDLSGRQVKINNFRKGEPPFPFVKQVGKPAAKACNTIARSIEPDRFYHDEPLIKCN